MPPGYQLHPKLGCHMVVTLQSLSLQEPPAPRHGCVLTAGTAQCFPGVQNTRSHQLRDTSASIFPFSPLGPSHHLCSPPALRILCDAAGDKSHARLRLGL